MEVEHVFQQIAVLLLLATVLGFAATRLRQPLIVGFLAAGILAGPQVLGVVGDPADIQLLATIGISLLLFVVGLKLDLTLVRTLGPVALVTGLGQILFTAVLGYAIARALGIPTMPALYMSVALTFSSTIIVVKLLSDKRETEELHGRIAIGVLIVQDIVVVLVMIALTAFGDPGAGGLGEQVLLVLLKGAGFLAFILACMRWVLPPLLHRLAHRSEMLVLFSITWAIVLAAAGDALGFSEEVGAFLAGVSLASTPYREAISGRLVSLRDFLLLFFFIDLGANLDLGQLGDLLVPALALSLFVLIGKPFIVMVIMGAMGYRKRVSFLSGLTLAQISEFSLILVALGLGLGHIGPDTVGLATAVGLITIGLSTYLIYNAHTIFDRLAPMLDVFERERVRNLPEDGGELAPEVLVIGLGRLGSAVMEELLDAGIDVAGVDFDPAALRQWANRGVPVVYGDAEDPELPQSLPLSRAAWIMSTVRAGDANLALVHALGQHGYRGAVAVSANTADEARRLRERGADAVLSPFIYTAQRARELLNPRRARPRDDGYPDGTPR